MKKVWIGTGLLALSVIVSGCAQENTESNQEQNMTEQKETDQPKVSDEANKEDVKMTGSIANDNFFTDYKGVLEHIHGMGYAGNQNALFIASHDGLKVYENGNWFKTKENNFDYMGFTPVAEGFYTSGHPSEGSDYPNPLGLKRSFDNGQTLEDLGFEGESDFHALAVGYESKVIYLLNSGENSKLGSGLYVSKDDGGTWEEIKVDDIGYEIFAIAAHPTNENIFALSGKNGVFLSTDGGATFEDMKQGRQGTAVFFTDEFLYYGTHSGDQATLTKHSLTDGSETNVNVPELVNDAVMYMAQNPKNDNELSLVTFNGNVHFSQDSGQSWKEIVSAGEIK
ncbi:F510_1955 family glycosylhydrolase [Bacillus solimangrovi]|uniref:Sortilin N-terminal domain-containing protein n=1 Tax=Bacillus solimangrovi TaxID=1305675 RepID=A0A1E5LFB6_9BACI|nr:hypothetical protein [Bacillus solimangrovi]OEH92764.1 hypothetical protein BFG57_01830 [Bacillus solimangrovi]